MQKERRTTYRLNRPFKVSCITDQGTFNDVEALNMSYEGAALCLPSGARPQKVTIALNAQDSVEMHCWPVRRVGRARDEQIVGVQFLSESLEVTRRLRHWLFRRDGELAQSRHHNFWPPKLKPRSG